MVQPNVEQCWIFKQKKLKCEEKINLFIVKIRTTRTFAHLDFCLFCDLIHIDFNKALTSEDEAKQGNVENVNKFQKMFYCILCIRSVKYSP